MITLMTWRKFKEGDEVTIRNLLQQDNLNRNIYEKKLYHPDNDTWRLPYDRQLGAKGVVEIAMPHRGFQASGWYGIRVPAFADSVTSKFMIAHDTELIKTDELARALYDSRIRSNSSSKSAMERWLA